MGKCVDVQMGISVARDEWVGPKLLFQRWLPLGVEKGLLLKTEQMTVRYWFDLKCVAVLGAVPEEDISQYVTVPANRVNVLASLPDVDDDLAELVLLLSREKNWHEDHLFAAYGEGRVERYRQMTRTIYSVVTRGYNRIVAFCRAHKGQHWLNEYRVEERNVDSAFLGQAARARVGESDWVLFRSGESRHHFTCTMPNPERALSEADWPALERFLNGRSRPELVGTLLAIAEELRAAEHSRAALIEVVSALESAVSKFVSKSDAETWFASHAERFGVANLEAHRKHLGFTCTVSYLFPLLFTEEQVSTETLRDCRHAIEERNNVVHNGQRVVAEEKLARYLKSVRLLCRFLLAQCPQEEE